ncbi:Kinase-Associated Endopeptidase [Clostridiaceae bacterium JG1575]|nr:Kinase-Associated Endopeptidase [Clostridiaceae bacterium JG1575]
MEKDTFILGIETSCDETAAAVVKNGRTICSNIISSQIPVHRKFGGVVPEVASRHHTEQITYVVDLALKEAEISLEELSGIAVTAGPGLVGALLVGLQYAKGLSFALNKPLLAVNHIHGHISANYLAHPDLVPPFVSLVVSGGHTFIVRVRSYKDFQVVAQTRDDAVGEAFDKVARALGLPYPGGPQIDRLAKEGCEDAIAFARPKFSEQTLDFSFSGIKSGVLNYLNSAKLKEEPVNAADVAASFQKAVVENLLDHLFQAARQEGAVRIAVAGGVASNSYLRDKLSRRGAQEGIEILVPPPILCTDNAAMIACAGTHLFWAKEESPLSVNASPSLGLNDPLGH